MDVVNMSWISKRVCMPKLTQIGTVKVAIAWRIPRVISSNANVLADVNVATRRIVVHSRALYALLARPFWNVSILIAGKNCGAVR
jgi:hypothetical protein